MRTNITGNLKKSIWMTGWMAVSMAGLLVFSISTVQASGFDWQLWNNLLQKHVKSAEREGVRLNVIDYPALKRSQDFKQIIAKLAVFDPTTLDNQQDGRDARLAFYINAYNILAVKMIVDHWQPQSIRDIGHFLNPVWKHDAGTISHKTVSLHQIEHEILRPMGEPRIHFAIVCASISCPDLRPEAYTEDKLEQQLDEQVLQFLNNTEKGLKIEKDELLVSSIFDWFEDDFDSSGGVREFISRYRPDLTIRGKDIEADLPYNWHLNY